MISMLVKSEAISSPRTHLLQSYTFFYMMALPITLWAGYKKIRPKWFQTQKKSSTEPDSGGKQCTA